MKAGSGRGGMARGGYGNHRPFPYGMQGLAGGGRGTPHPGLAQRSSLSLLPKKSPPPGQPMIIRFNEDENDEDDDDLGTPRGPTSSAGTAVSAGTASGGGVLERTSSRKTSSAAAPSPKKLKGAKGKAPSAAGPGIKAPATSRRTQLHDPARAKAAASAQALSAAASAGLLQQIAQMRKQIETMQTSARSANASTLPAVPVAGVALQGPGAAQRPGKRAKVAPDGAMDIGYPASNQAGVPTLHTAEAEASCALEGRHRAQTAQEHLRAEAHAQESGLPLDQRGDMDAMAVIGVQLRGIEENVAHLEGAVLAQGGGSAHFGGAEGGTHVQLGSEGVAGGRGSDGSEECHDEGIGHGEGEGEGDGEGARQGEEESEEDEEESEEGEGEEEGGGGEEGAEGVDGEQWKHGRVKWADGEEREMAMDWKYRVLDRPNGAEQSPELRARTWAPRGTETLPFGGGPAEPIDAFSQLVPFQTPPGHTRPALNMAGPQGWGPRGSGGGVFGSERGELLRQEAEVERELAACQERRRRCEEAEAGARRALREAQEARLSAEAQCAELQHIRDGISARLASVPPSSSAPRILGPTLSTPSEGRLSHGSAPSLPPSSYPYHPWSHQHPQQQHSQHLQSAPHGAPGRSLDPSHVQQLEYESFQGRAHYPASGSRPVHPTAHGLSQHGPVGHVNPRFFSHQLPAEQQEEWPSSDHRDSREAGIEAEKARRRGLGISSASPAAGAWTEGPRSQPVDRAMTAASGAGGGPAAAGTDAGGPPARGGAAPVANGVPPVPPEALAGWVEGGKKKRKRQKKGSVPAPSVHAPGADGEVIGAEGGSIGSEEGSKSGGPGKAAMDKKGSAPTPSGQAQGVDGEVIGAEGGSIGPGGGSKSGGPEKAAVGKKRHLADRDEPEQPEKEQAKRSDDAGQAGHGQVPFQKSEARQPAAGAAAEKQQKLLALLRKQGQKPKKKEQIREEQEQRVTPEQMQKAEAPEKEKGRNEEGRGAEQPQQEQRQHHHESAAEAQAVKQDGKESVQEQGKSALPSAVGQKLSSAEDSVEQHGREHGAVLLPAKEQAEQGSGGGKVTEQKAQDELLLEAGIVPNRSPCPVPSAPAPENEAAAKRKAELIRQRLKVQLARQEGAKKEVAEKEGAKNEGAKEEGAKTEGAKTEGAKMEGAKTEGAKKVVAEKEGAIEEGAKTEGAKKDASKSDGQLGKKPATGAGTGKPAPVQKGQADSGLKAAAIAAAPAGSGAGTGAEPSPVQKGKAGEGQKGADIGAVSSKNGAEKGAGQAPVAVRVQGTGHAKGKEGAKDIMASKATQQGVDQAKSRVGGKETVTAATTQQGTGQAKGGDVAKSNTGTGRNGRDEPGKEDQTTTPQGGAGKTGATPGQAKGVPIRPSAGAPQPPPLNGKPAPVPVPAVPPAPLPGVPPVPSVSLQALPAAAQSAKLPPLAAPRAESKGNGNAGLTAPKGGTPAIGRHAPALLPVKVDPEPPSASPASQGAAASASAAANGVAVPDVGRGSGALEQPGSKGVPGREQAQPRLEIEYDRAGRKGAAIGAKARAEFELKSGAVNSVYVSPLLCLPQYRAKNHNVVPAKNGAGPHTLAGEGVAPGKLALPDSWKADVPLCPFQFRGHCNNPKCPMQHLSPR